MFGFISKFYLLFPLKNVFIIVIINDCDQFFKFNLKKIITSVILMCVHPAKCLNKLEYTPQYSLYMAALEQVSQTSAGLEPDFSQTLAGF